jgi:EpsI family protein
MVPLPYTMYYRLSFPLQLLSARIAAGSLDLIGLDVVRWGNIFEVNGHPLEVVRACSGIRSMMTLGTMAAALGVTLAFRPWAGVTMLALSAPIAMIGNSVRLIVTALLVLQFGPHMSEGWQHEAVGFFGFAISLLLLGGLAKRLQRSAADKPESKRHEQAVPGEAASIVPRLRAGWQMLQPHSARAAWIAVVLFAGSATYGMVLRSHTVEPQRQSNLQAFPLELPGLQGEELGLSSRILEQVGVDDYLFRVYNAEDSPNINLYVGYYRSQRQGSQIHSPQHCYPGSGWDIEQSEPLRVRNFEGNVEELRRLVVRHNDRQDVVVYWYDTRTGRLSNDFKLKFNLMRTALLHLPQDAAFVRWSTPVAEGEDVEGATLRLLGVAARSLPDLDSSLPFGG